jgi:multidrug efflux pump subunit AcrA (membrane-fusion protein)
MRTRILIIIAVFLGSAGCGGREESYTVKKGQFRQTITETGELTAVRHNSIIMPMISYEYGYEFKILALAEQGQMVKAGDTVVTIDPSSLEKIIITKQEALESELAAEKKLKVQIENNQQDMQAQLRNEQATFDLKKLQMERSKFEPESKRRISDLEFKQANLRMEKVKRQLSNKAKFDESDYKIQQIKVKQVKEELEKVKGLLSKLILTSPADGLFQIEASRYEYPPKPLKAGDRVYIGSRIAKIPDIYHMKVTTSVNEVDFTKVTVGTPVIVRLDALRRVPFHGTISEISKACVQRDQKKVFNVVVVITESDLRLKPGMTVSCEFVCREVEDAVFVPNSCLLREEDKAFVFVDKGGAPRKTEVEAGAYNGFYTMISSELEPGQKLVPFEEVLNPKMK